MRGEEKISPRPPLLRKKIMELKTFLLMKLFKMYATHGLSPTQIKSLGYIF